MEGEEILHQPQIMGNGKKVMMALVTLQCWYVCNDHTALHTAMFGAVVSQRMSDRSVAS